jgi:hypothetical protein
MTPQSRRKRKAVEVVVPPKSFKRPAPSSQPQAQGSEGGSDSDGDTWIPPFAVTFEVSYVIFQLNGGLKSDFSVTDVWTRASNASHIRQMPASGAMITRWGAVWYLKTLQLARPIDKSSPPSLSSSIGLSSARRSQSPVQRRRRSKERSQCALSRKTRNQRRQGRGHRLQLLLEISQNRFWIAHRPKVNPLCLSRHQPRPTSLPMFLPRKVSFHALGLIDSPPQSLYLNQTMKIEASQPGLQHWR